MPHLLFIDDHKRTLQLIGVMMSATRFGACESTMVERLSDAEDMLARRTASLIFLDNYLPPHRSFHVPLQRLQAISDAPIILMTSSDLADLGETDIPEGFADYLPKTELSVARLEGLLAAYLGEPPEFKAE
ncbi:MAG: hypothetical protein CMK09_05285 [Ponticaulis sp.]|nr:hypothetical protein [Ponticaulis sp.]|tara:strand:- start:13853 stop:14245 length:393 start_codon:yes stop_codon:yes gene_type:complete